MKEIFDFKRFGKYFRYDLSHAVSSYWIPALIIGLFPFIWHSLTRLLTFIFSLDPDLLVNSQQYRSFTVWGLFLMLIVSMSFGARVYGGVTDRKKGTDWISIPASALEKTLSLLLITCVVLPVVLYVLMTLCNALLILLNPSLNGYAHVLPFSTLLHQLDPIVNDLMPFGGTVSKLNKSATGNFINAPLIIWLNWCENILAFTLGALCFKRNKVGKTILCYIAFGILISCLMMLIFHTTNIDSDTIERFLGDFDEARAQTWINVGLNLIYGVVFAALIGGIWARIKTIKA